MTLFTIVGPQPVRVIAAGDGPGVLVNRDLTNQAWTSTEQGFNAGDVTASIHDPLIGIPYDGDEDVYATVATGVSIQMDYMQNAQNWAPSPAQAAQQISALGLATAANQATQIANEAAINNTLGSPPQNATVVNPNPYLMGGSSVGYTAGAGAGIAVTSKPAAGAPASYSIVVTPGGGVTQPGFTGGVFPVTGSTKYQFRVGMVLPFTDVNITSVFVGLAWFSDAAGTVQISRGGSNLQVPPANQWVWLNSGTAGLVSPSNALSARLVVFITGTANVAAADVYQVAYMPVFTAVPGVPAQDSTLAHLHDRIAVTGTPLLHGYNAVRAPTSAFNVAVGTPQNFTFPIAKPGYIVQFGVTYAAAAVNPMIQVVMSWQDSATNTEIAREVWYMNGNTTVLNTYGKGPTKGNQLVVTITNMDTAGSGSVASVSFSLEETTQHIQRDDWRSGPLGTISVNQPNALFINSTNDPFALLPGWIVHAYAGAETDYFLLPLYCGQAIIQATQGVNQTIAAVRMFAWDPSINNTDFRSCPIIFSQQPTAANVYAGPFTVNMPRCPCILQVTAGAAAVTINMAVQTLEYAS